MIVSVSAFKNPSSVSLGKYLESNSGTHQRKRVPFKRLWCVVEISSAVDAGIDVVVKCGNSQLIQSNGTYKYCLSNIKDMWELQYTIDVEQCECSDSQDQIQQLQIVREQQGGVERVNKVVEGVVSGAVLVHNSPYIDAAVCGELGALNQIMSPAGLQSSLIQASAGGRLKVVQILLKRFCNQQQKKNVILHVGAQCLWEATNGSHLEVVRLLVNEVQGLDINHVDNKNGSTALCRACFKGHAEVVEYFLGFDGIDVNRYRDSDGLTPLACASQKGHARVVKLLLTTSLDLEQDVNSSRQKIDVNQAADWYNYWTTPLQQACAGNHVEIVGVLLDHPKIDVNKPNICGLTPRCLICLRIPHIFFCGKHHAEKHTQIKQRLKDAQGKVLSMHSVLLCCSAVLILGFLAREFIYFSQCFFVRVSEWKLVGSDTSSEMCNSMDEPFVPGLESHESVPQILLNLVMKPWVDSVMYLHGKNYPSIVIFLFDEFICIIFCPIVIFLVTYVWHYVASFWDRDARRRFHVHSRGEGAERRLSDFKWKDPSGLCFVASVMVVFFAFTFFARDHRTPAQFRLDFKKTKVELEIKRDLFDAEKKLKFDKKMEQEDIEQRRRGYCNYESRFSTEKKSTGFPSLDTFRNVATKLATFSTCGIFKIEFDTFDRNGDGLLNATEQSAVGWPEGTYCLMDTDESQTIDWFEYRTYVAHAPRVLFKDGRTGVKGRFIDEMGNQEVKIDGTNEQILMRNDTIIVEPPITEEQHKKCFTKVTRDKMTRDLNSAIAFFFQLRHSGYDFSRVVNIPSINHQITLPSLMSLTEVAITKMMEQLKEL